MDGVTLAAFEKQSAELVTCRQMLQKLEGEVKNNRIEVRTKLQSASDTEEQLRKELHEAAVEKSLLNAQLSAAARRLEELEEQGTQPLRGDVASELGEEGNVVSLKINVVEAVVLNLVVHELGEVKRPTVLQPNAGEVMDASKEDLMEVDEGRDDLCKKIHEQETTSRQMQEAMEALKVEVKSKEVDLRGNEIAIQRLTETLDQLESEKQELLQTVHDLKAAHEEELGKAKRETLEATSSLARKAEALIQSESRLSASLQRWESEKSLLSTSLSESRQQCHALQEEVDQLKAELGNERSTVSARNEEIEKLVPHVEQLQNQISELESHQLEKSSLYREYRQLKSKDLEVTALKEMHKEREEAWASAKASLQQELQQIRQFRDFEAEQHTSKVLELKKKIQDTERTMEKLKEQYQHVFHEREQLKEQESALRADLTECEEKIITEEKLRLAQVDELEQFIEHLKGDSLVFPLSHSKKRKISDSDEELRNEDQQQDDLSTEELIIQHAQTVSQLRMEKKKSKQKDDYVRFIRTTQQSKNDVIRSLQRENCTLQQRVEEQKVTSRALSDKSRALQSGDGSKEIHVATIQAKLRNEAAVNQQLSQQVQSLLDENARLRSDPFANRAVGGLSERSHRTLSIEDVQQHNVSLQRRLLEAQTTITALKEQMTLAVEAAKEDMRKATVEEKAMLESQIYSLKAVLEQSNLCARDLKANVEELMQGRQRLIRSLNRDQEIAELREKYIVSQREREKSETTYENLKEKYQMLERQLHAAVQEKALVHSEVELMKHQLRDSSLLSDGA